MNRDRSISKALDVLKGFDGIAAIGLSGSWARGTHDQMSDLDIAIFTSERIPDPQTRRRRYATCGLSDLSYFDVDFEVCRSDGLEIEGVDCDLIWMGLAATRGFLQGLTKDFDCDEFLPGALMTMRPLIDPDKTIASLRASVPSYPQDRAKHRITRNLSHAHFSIYVLAWLEKAVVRNDCFSFLKSEYEALDDFFTSLFAVNRHWYSDEKRLTEIVRGFRKAPEDVGHRIESIIMRRNECATLGGSLQEIKRLFSDLATMSREAYANLCIPTAWK
jgi:predicted nucleotidyltransferase